VVSGVGQWMDVLDGVHVEGEVLGVLRSHCFEWHIFKNRNVFVRENLRRFPYGQYIAGNLFIGLLKKQPVLDQTWGLHEICKKNVTMISRRNHAK